MNFHILPNVEGKIRLMFLDEARFGRISSPEYCWCFDDIRPVVPCHMVREYIYAYGAVDPIDGERCFITAPTCNTNWTNAFLKELSAQFYKDYILLCGDNAGWHKSKGLMIPDNIEFFHIPPYTPEMNPIEQIWRELRTCGFKNTLFSTLQKVEDKVCEVILALNADTVKSITGRDWILSML